jgi:hypothetical protein
MNKNNQIWIFVFGGVSLLVLVAVIFFFLNSNKEDSDSKSSNSSSSISNSENEPAPSELTFSALEGQYRGLGSLLTTSLAFPRVNLQFSDSDQAKLEASGLSLSLLGNPELQVNGVYPTTTVTGQADATITEDQNLILNIKTLEVSFLIDGQDVDAPNTTRLIGLLGQSGIVIPEISEANPTSIEAQITLEDDKLNIVSGLESELFLRLNLIKI